MHADVGILGEGRGELRPRPPLHRPSTRDSLAEWAPQAKREPPSRLSAPLPRPLCVDLPPICARLPAAPSGPALAAPAPPPLLRPQAGKQMAPHGSGWRERGLIKGKADFSSCRSCTDRREKNNKPKTPKPSNSPQLHKPVSEADCSPLTPREGKAARPESAQGAGPGGGGGTRRQPLHQRAAAPATQCAHTGQGRAGGWEKHKGLRVPLGGGFTLSGLAKKNKNKTKPQTPRQTEAVTEASGTPTPRRARPHPARPPGPSCALAHGAVTSTAVDMAMASVIPLGPLPAVCTSALGPRA